MPGPQDPDSSSESPRDPATERAAEDAMWASIVENYGERVTLDDEPDGPDEVVERPEDVIGEVPGSTRDLFRDLRPEPATESPELETEHYVPPPPPPVPTTTPARMIAWAGLFGVPVAVLVAVVAGLPVASWLGLILMVWFVGGFVFLVASMRSEPRDDDDDGAVV